MRKKKKQGMFMEHVQGRGGQIKSKSYVPGITMDSDVGYEADSEDNEIDVVLHDLIELRIKTRKEVNKIKHKHAEGVRELVKRYEDLEVETRALIHWYGY
jgi:hypothetical protein